MIKAERAVLIDSQSPYIRWFRDQEVISVHDILAVP
jgi:hypothetical protein